MPRWPENDAQLHNDLASALATRADDFSPHCVAPLQQLMAGHTGPQNMAVVGAITHWDTDAADPDPANPDGAPEKPAPKRRRKGGSCLRLVQAREWEGLSTRRTLWT